MDMSGENSHDSVGNGDMNLLTMQPLGLPTELTITDPSAIMNGDPLPIENHNNQLPYVVIVEQPQQRGFRFRYECEGPSHGGLQGVNTERSRKTHPSIRIENYDGPARLEVSLVTDETPPKIHAHKLVGKNCTDGICKLDISSTASQISFPNLCVLHVTRKKAAEVLMNRILEDVKLQKMMRSGLADQSSTQEELQSAKKQAQDQARNMSLSVVKLQFRVFLPNAEGNFLNMLTPVVSQPIYDSKSPGASALKICRMDKYGGCCTGNEEVFLLCEKVQKEDIAVRFVEQNDDGSVKWEAHGNFSTLDVHRQYAIVFKTPAYYNANIDKAVNVMIMLQRKSDQEVSEAKAFTYYPQNKDKDLIARKKRKKLPLDNTFNYYGGDGGPGSGPPGPGGGMGGGYGPLGHNGPGGGMNGGGGGGMGGQGNFSVVLPNGSMGQLNVLPTTVEQVVKEEFARNHAESPEATSAEESSPMASPDDPMLWNEVLNDLETDAAPSLRQSCVFQGVEPSKWSDTTDKMISGHSVCSELQRDSEADPTIHSPFTNSSKGYLGRFDVQQETTSKIEIPGSSDFDTVDGLLPQPDTVDEVRFGFDSVDGFIAKSDTANRAVPGINDVDGSVTKTESIKMAQAVVQTPTEDLIVDNCEVSGKKQKKDSRLQLITVPLAEETQKGGKSDIVLSPTRLSEVTVSEGFRTDEGFSEVSEVSVKDEAPSEKPTSNETLKPCLTKRSLSAEDKKNILSSNVQMKTATSIVKRVIERITARTIRALQDFSETGDIRYLLLVQRHLTAVKNENGDLPVHLAVINNQTLSLQNLLDVMTSLPNAHRSVNTYNYMRQTALHLAAIMQQSYHIELLLHAGADPSLADRNGNTPAHLAVLNNTLEGLQSLIKYLRPGVTATNPFPELNYLNYDGYSPVHLAAQCSNVDMLRLLVHGQANVNMPDGKSGRTALHHAVELDDLPVAGFLLMEAGANVNARCFDGNTPLHVACCRGLIGMVALLMTAGAHTNVENEEVPPEDYSDDDGVEEAPVRCRRGLQPSDYASGKDRKQILSMLAGDSYLSDGEEHHHSMDEEDDDLEEDTETMNRRKSTYDSGVAVSLTSHSGINFTVDGQLSYEMRVELSKLLDPVNIGKDVFELASRLGYDNLVAPLEVMGCSGSSPTHFLLDYHESYGTLGKLRECLQAMERDDAVQLLHVSPKGLSQKKQQDDHSSTRDSGLISFSS